MKSKDLSEELTRGIVRGAVQRYCQRSCSEVLSEELLIFTQDSTTRSRGIVRRMESLGYLLTLKSKDLFAVLAGFGNFNGYRYRYLPFFGWPTADLEKHISDLFAVLLKS